MALSRKKCLKVTVAPQPETQDDGKISERLGRVQAFV
jgi:hypothetical protein